MNSFLKALTTNPFSQIWFILRIQSFWTFFNMTHTIGSKIEHFFSTWLKENVSFLVWLKEYFFLTQCMTQRINWSFLENKTQRIEPFFFFFFFQFDSKNWTLFLECDSKIWTFFSKWLKELFLFFNMTWRIEPSFLNMSLWIEPFCRLTQRIEPCFFFLNMTQRPDPLQKYDFQELNLLKIWIKGLNFWKCDSKHWTLFFNMSQRIKPTFPTWVKENFFFLNMTHKTQRIETSFNKWLEELNFFEEKTWLTELNHFFHVTHGIEPFFPTWVIVLNPFFWIWLKELKIFHEFLTQRIESFLNMTRKSELFFLNVTHRIEFFMTQELSFFQYDKDFVEYDSKNRTFFWKYVQRTFFQYDSQNWTYFSALPIEWNTWENDSKNWTFIAIKHDTKNWTSCEIKFVLHDPKNWTFSNMTRRIELFFWTWLTELSFFFFWKWLKELNLFEKWLQELIFWKISQ